MKTLLTLLFGFILATSFAMESKRLLADYSMDSIVKDPTIKKGYATFIFTFKNIPLQNESAVFYYSDGKAQKGNLTGKLDEKNQFRLINKADMYLFQFYYSNNYYEITTDSIKIEEQSIMYISLNFQFANEMIIIDKPVIYLYPASPTLVEVLVEPKGYFTFTYPDYKNGWNIQANPNGEINIDSKTYNYLFWESAQRVNSEMIDLNYGFLVNKENTISFLEEKLTEFGLNDKEQADFITYWGPQLIKNPKNYIHFVLNDNCDQFATLNITPKPDHIYRIYLLTFPVNYPKDMHVIDQKIPTMDRSGFTVIEWGGSNISTLHAPTVLN